MSAPLAQVIALIDGFNLFHAIAGLGDPRLKWCDVSDLASRFLKKGEALTQTRYYTASPVHRSSESQARHADYVAAICARSGGSFVVRRGRFKRKRPQILKYERGGVSVQVKTKFHEEKETDVLMAVDIMDLAQQARERGERLTFVLMSGDSDLRPAVALALERFPAVSFVLLLPPRQQSERLRALVKKWPNRVRVSQVKRAHIEKSRMPERFSAPAGKDHHAPKSYRDSPSSRFPSEIM